MDMILVSACPKLQNCIRSSLEALGYELENAAVANVQAAIARLRTIPAGASLLVFYGIPVFTSGELTALQQLHKALEGRGKLVAFGATFESKQILQIIRQGVADYLDVQHQFETELAALLQRCSHKHHEMGVPAQVYTFFNPDGNQEASMLAVNVAMSLADQQELCGLLDFQLQGGVQANLLNVTPRYTLHSLAGKAPQLDAKMFDHLMIELESGLQLLAGPEPSLDSRQYAYGEQLIPRVMQLASSRFDRVVIDLGKLETETQAAIIAQSDQVILTLSPNIVSLYRTLKLLDFLQQKDFPETRICLVAVNSDQAHALPVHKINEVLGQPVTHCLPTDFGNQNKALNLGQPLVHSAPHAKLTRMINHFVQDLIGERRVDEPSTLLRPFYSAACRLGQLF